MTLHLPHSTHTPGHTPINKADLSRREGGGRRELQRTAGVLHFVYSLVPLHVSPPLSWGSPGCPLSSNSCGFTVKPARRVTSECDVKLSQPALGETCAVEGAVGRPAQHRATPPTRVLWALQRAALVSPGQPGSLWPDAIRPGGARGFAF